MEDADFRVSRVVRFNSHLSALEFGFDLSNSKTIEQYIRSSEVHREFPGQVGVVRQVVDGKDLSDLHVSPMHTHAQNQLLSAYCWTTEGAFLSVTYGTSASQTRGYRTMNALNRYALVDIVQGVNIVAFNVNIDIFSLTLYVACRLNDSPFRK